MHLCSGAAPAEAAHLAPHLSSPARSCPPPSAGAPHPAAGPVTLGSMHHASDLVLPASARPWLRPVGPPQGTRHLTHEELGLASRQELLELGYTDAGLTRAVRSGRFGRVHRGWYENAAAVPRARRALRHGFHLTCIDAAEMHGLWTPYRDEEERRTLHVYRPNGSPGTPKDMLAHPSRSRAWPEPDAVASLPLALEHAMRCLDGECAAVLLESAMARRLMSPTEVQQLVDAAPAAVRSRLGTLSTASDSGSETRVVRWLRRRGFQVEQQVFVDGAGYVDLYVGGLLLEIDGRDGHSGREAFAKDRRRDLRTGRHGLQILRLSYEQVWRSWADTQDAVLETIDQVGAFGRRKVERLLVS